MTEPYGPLSPCRVWWRWDFAYLWGAKKLDMFTSSMREAQRRYLGNLGGAIWVFFRPAGVTCCGDLGEI